MDDDYEEIFAVRKRIGWNTQQKQPERCPNNHPLWNNYHKRVEGTTETIICCRKCDAEQG